MLVAVVDQVVETSIPSVVVLLLLLPLILDRLSVIWMATRSWLVLLLGLWARLPIGKQALESSERGER